MGRSAREEQSEGNHADAQCQVKPVVGTVDRHKVGRAVMINDESVDPEDQIDDSAPEQILAGAAAGFGHGNSAHAEEQVHNVVQDGDLEDPQQHCFGVVACEGELVIVARDPGDESQNSNEQKDCSDGEGRHLYIAALSAGMGNVAGHVLHLSEDSGYSDLLCPPIIALPFSLRKTSTVIDRNSL